MIERLRARVDRLRALAEAQQFRERKSAIVADTSGVTFWDDAVRARGQLAELTHLEEVLEGLDAAQRALDELADFAAAYQRQGAKLKAKFELSHGAFLERILQLEYKFLGERPEDRRDVFVTLVRIGADKDAAEAIDALHKMYLAWAERRGFAVTWLDRRGDEHGLAEATFLIEGLSLYGLVKREAGLHKFELGGKGADKQAAFVRVDVLPVNTGERGIAKRDVKITRSGRGRGDLTLVHAPSGTSLSSIGAAVAAPPSLSGEGFEDLLLDLLAARIAAHRANGDGADPDRVVRRYNLAARYIRDEDTGVRTSHVKEVLAGGLDELLRPRLFGG